MRPENGWSDALRVALLSYRGNPRSGGQGVYVRFLSRELARLGHEVTVFSGQPWPVLDEAEGVNLVEVPGLDLYREPDPFRFPKLSEFRSPVDVLEWGTVMTGGFPEPLTFSLRVRALLSRRRREFDIVHDNQSFGSGLAWLDGRRLAAHRDVPPPGYRRQIGRARARSEPPERALAAPLVRVREDAKPGGPPDPPCDHRVVLVSS